MDCSFKGFSPGYKPFATSTFKDNLSSPHPSCKRECIFIATLQKSTPTGRLVRKNHRGVTPCIFWHQPVEIGDICGSVIFPQANGRFMTSSLGRRSEGCGGTFSLGYLKMALFLFKVSNPKNRFWLVHAFNLGLWDITIIGWPLQTNPQN